MKKRLKPGRGDTYYTIYTEQCAAEYCMCNSNSLLILIFLKTAHISVCAHHHVGERERQEERRMERSKRNQYLSN